MSSVYATPVWQSGKGVPANDPGAAAQHHRYLPDVSLAAAGHEGYLVFHEGSLYMVGGTSASSPAFAGLMAIVDQYTGGRNGNPNTRFYSLAASGARGLPRCHHRHHRGALRGRLAGMFHVRAVRHCRRHDRLSPRPNTTISPPAWARWTLT